MLGANGGVGSPLVQLARQAGIRVIGTASARHHDRLRALGAIPVDYRHEDVPARVRELAPSGVAAVFDHVGGAGIVEVTARVARTFPLAQAAEALRYAESGAVSGKFSYSPKPDSALAHAGPGIRATLRRAMSVVQVSAGRRAGSTCDGGMNETGPAYVTG